MDDLLKLILPTAISGVVLLLQLFISSKISPLDKKLTVICSTVQDMKLDNEKQWTEIGRVKSDFDVMRGEHHVNHSDRRSK